MKRSTLNIWRFSYFLPLSFLLYFLSTPLLFATTTTTHSYDDLNRLTQSVYNTGAKVTIISYTYDPAGNMLSYSISANFLLGDVDDSKNVDLTDVVLCLQLTSGMTPSATIYQGADIDGDNRLGTVELIHVLQKVAGLK